jgi:ubiquinone/menaquinone biosynthesis C-methylase UbiE
LATLHARDVTHELLDGERLDPADLRINLREMAMLNRLPGGTADSVRETLRLLDKSNHPAVLDVGTGSGDFARRLRGRRRAAHITAIDLRPEVLEIAARNLRDTNDVTLLQADARSLPFDDGAVDVAHASLLLHHFDPTDAVAALREMRRVARRGVVINDLRRGQVAFAISALTVLALSRGRYTRHDGVLSARRAYTLPELDDLAAEAGLHLATRTLPILPRVTSVYT